MKHTLRLIVSVIASAFAYTALAQPVNDEAAGAITLSVVASDAYGNNCTPSTNISWTGATVSANSIWSCGYVNIIADVWYKVTVPASGSYRVILAPATGVSQTEEGYQVSLAATDIYSNISSYTECTQYINLEYPIVSTSGRTPNSTEYIRIWKQSGVTAGNLKICVMDAPPMAASNQRVGIGISSPRANLDVNGNLHAQGNITTYGKIGMGTANPQYTLDMVGRMQLRAESGKNETPGIWMHRLSNTGNPPIFLGLASDSVFGIYSTGGIDWNGFTMNYRTGLISMNQGVKFPNQLGRFTIRKDPSQASGETAGHWLNKNDNTGPAAFIGLYNDTQVGLFGNGGAGWGLTMNTTTGNVGIGLNGAAAQAPLQFSNALGLTKISLYKGTYGDVGIGVYGGELRLQNDIPNGKISMGVIQTNGSYAELAKAERNGAYAFSIFGSLWANGTTYASDGRFKKNIEPLQESLEKVLQLQGVSYEMKTEEFPNQHFNAGQQVGLIAQEVEKIVPEVVSENPDGYKAIDYSKLVPLLIESIKAQQAMLLKQQAEIDALKKKRKSK
ncbi:tail fiber domain-containing protein [Phnomibacter sp. MR]|uniref:tail fiber domain-containing protein n=1 Tax=Phnomibacter sp. MR TaxID=3042318 RepID=UPI003A7FED04